jgi:hypothetical protein
MGGGAKPMKLRSAAHRRSVARGGLAGACELEIANSAFEALDLAGHRFDGDDDLAEAMVLLLRGAERVAGPAHEPGARFIVSARGRDRRPR